MGAQAEAYDMETDRRRDPFRMRATRRLPDRGEIDARKEV